MEKKKCHVTKLLTHTTPFSLCFPSYILCPQHIYIFLSADVLHCSSHYSHNSFTSSVFSFDSMYVDYSLPSKHTQLGFWIQTFPETQLWRSGAISGYSPTMSHVGRVCRGKPHNNLMRQHTTLWSMCVILFVCNSMWTVAVAVVAVCRNRLALYELFGLWCRRWSLLISFSPHFLSHKHVVVTLMSCLL